MINSQHIYIDGTFITTKDYYQLIVIMYYDTNANKKIPGCYILINNKSKQGYLKAFSAFKRLLTIENTIEINIKSITSDFEEALMNAINESFPKIRKVGCLFHYIKQLRLNMNKKGLINENFNHKEFLTDLSSIPFKINNDKYLLSNIFSVYINRYKKDKHISDLLESFKTYYNNTWKKFLINGALNYYNISKLERTNCYLENYNKRIKKN